MVSLEQEMQRHDRWMQQLEDKQRRIRELQAYIGKDIAEQIHQEMEISRLKGAKYGSLAGVGSFTIAMSGIAAEKRKTLSRRQVFKYVLPTIAGGLTSYVLGSTLGSGFSTGMYKERVARMLSEEFPEKRAEIKEYMELMYPQPKI